MYNYNSVKNIKKVQLIIEQQIAIAEFENAPINPNMFDKLYNRFPLPIIQEAIDNIIQEENDIVDFEQQLLEEGLGTLATRIATKPLRAAGKYAGSKLKMAWDNSGGAKIKEWDQKVNKWINSKSSSLGKHTERFLEPILARMIKDYRNSSKLVAEIKSSTRKNIASLNKIKKLTRNNSDTQLIRILISGLASTDCIDYHILGKALIKKGRDGISVNAANTKDVLTLYSDLGNTKEYKDAEKFREHIELLKSQVDKNNLSFYDLADFKTDLDEHLKETLKSTSKIDQFKKELGTWVDEWEKYNNKMTNIIKKLDAMSKL